MKNLKMFIMRHVGLMLTMIAGYAGMHASSESDFEKCIRAKKYFVDMCSVGVLEPDFIAGCFSAHNSVYYAALSACTKAQYGYSRNSEDISNHFNQELFRDVKNAKKSQSLVRCDQLRKDFTTALTCTESEANKTTIIKIFEKSLGDCNV